MRPKKGWLLFVQDLLALSSCQPHGIEGQLVWHAKGCLAKTYFFVPAFVVFIFMDQSLRTPRIEFL